MADHKIWVSELMGGSHDKADGMSKEDTRAIVSNSNLLAPLERRIYEGACIADIELRLGSDLTRTELTTLESSKQRIFQLIVS